jgi:hypothetical protein
MRRSSMLVLATVIAAIAVPTASAKVLRVGTYKGIKGQFKTIQAAVNAAKPHDWILVGPGDYKTKTGTKVKGEPALAGGVVITKAGIYLRGMDRNKVIVDGTKSGPACSRKASDQNLGPKGLGSRLGLNGILVFNAPDVWVQNLTACNFLGGAGESGNQIWWDAKEGTIAHGMFGSYLNATSTYFDPKNTHLAATYGIFSSRWSGGEWDNTYASNFNDSGYYIGACKQICNQTIDHGWGEYSALGYSGSNSGGQLVIKNSEFDNNEDGFDTNSQNGDNPPPQDGSCPNGKTSKITHTHSCWVFMNNFVHDNNNPNVPKLGSAAAGPVGTGMSVSGGRNDTIMNNRFENNGAWGIILVPYLDSGQPCTGGTLNPLGGALGSDACLYEGFGDAIVNNQFKHNGFFGHPSNGDFAHVSLEDNHPNDCYSGNTEIGGGSITPDAAALEAADPTCTSTPVAASSSNKDFLAEVLCDSQVELSPGTPSPCPSGQYPRTTKVVMHPLPTKKLKTMPNPCAGVPANPWCKGGKKK